MYVLLGVNSVYSSRDMVVWFVEFVVVVMVFVWCCWEVWSRFLVIVWVI